MHLVARILAVVLLTGLVAACGDGAAPRADGLELPEVGLLGDLPPAAGAVVVTVRADGALAVNGKACAWDKLGDRLDLLTKPPEPEGRERKVLRATMTAEMIEEDIEEVEEETVEVYEQEIVAEEPVIKDEVIVDGSGGDLPRETGNMSGKKLDLTLLVPKPRGPDPFALDGARNADVLLRIDRRVPWAVAMRVLMTLAEPRLKLPRVFYAVRGRHSATEGAVALFLPQDRGCGGVPLSGHEVTTVMLRATPGEPLTLRPARGPESPRRVGGYLGVTNDPQLGDELEEELEEPLPGDEAPFGDGK